MDSIDVRCSAIVFRDDAVLLVHRSRNGTDNWVLPGGTPHPGESMAACARRETMEETGLPVDPARIAFVLEALGPGSTLRTVDLVFLATADGHGEPEPREPDLEARFVVVFDVQPFPDCRLDPGFLGHFPAGGDQRMLAAAELSLRQRPVVVPRPVHQGHLDSPAVRQSPQDPAGGPDHPVAITMHDPPLRSETARGRISALLVLAHRVPRPGLLPIHKLGQQDPSARRQTSAPANGHDPGGIHHRVAHATT
jgi:8-oxo-dGTP diphosphatase